MNETPVALVKLVNSLHWKKDVCKLDVRKK